MASNNNKFKTEESKIWLERDGIVRIKIGKAISVETVERIINDYREMTKNLKDKPKILADIRLSTPIPSSLFRKKIAELIKNGYRDLEFGKMAIWGGILILKVITLFIISATGLENIKYFKTEEEALRWLKEE